ncbi:prepilin peptidase [Actinocorallia populi]|uniref:prepilin peptidase n=1 Tax=Actinocorallia populi TaxID=2079200 RepID=UPI000D09753F|nr:A24 family peptidase [Actinocorallia populi]
MTPTTPRDPWFDPVRRRPAPVALVALAVLALLAWRLGPRPDLAAFAVLGLAGTCLAFIDAELLRLPDPLTLPLLPVLLALLGLAAATGQDGSLTGALYGMGALLLVYGVLWFIAPSQIGLGDVKLAPSLGLALGWLGAEAFVTGVVAIHVLGGLWGAALLATRRAGRGSSFPFGPFMLAGTLAAVLLHG